MIQPSAAGQVPGQSRLPRYPMAPARTLPGWVAAWRRPGSPICAQAQGAIQEQQTLSLRTLEYLPLRNRTTCESTIKHSFLKPKMSYYTTFCKVEIITVKNIVRTAAPSDIYIISRVRLLIEAIVRPSRDRGLEAAVSHRFQ